MLRAVTRPFCIDPGSISDDQNTDLNSLLYIYQVHILSYFKVVRVSHQRFHFSATSSLALTQPDKVNPDTHAKMVPPGTLQATSELLRVRSGCTVEVHSPSSPAAVVVVGSVLKLIV